MADVQPIAPKNGCYVMLANPSFCILSIFPVIYALCTSQAQESCCDNDARKSFEIASRRFKELEAAMFGLLGYGTYGIHGAKTRKSQH